MVSSPVSIPGNTKRQPGLTAGPQDSPASRAVGGGGGGGGLRYTGIGSRDISTCKENNTFCLLDAPV